jgi:hypothetical protein
MRDESLLKQILEATRDVWDRPGTRPAVRKNFAAVLGCGTPALADSHDGKFPAMASRNSANCGLVVSDDP